VRDFEAVQRLVDEAVAAHAFPAAAIEVGRRDDVVWQHAAGRLTYDPEAAVTTIETIFDLASLTKVIAMAPLVMRVVAQRRLLLDTPVSRLVPAWRGHDRAGVTVTDLLEHSAGLTAWWPLYKQGASATEYAHLISELPLEYAPRRRSIYSDLGFILLGIIAADIGGAPLDAQFEAWLGDTGLTYRPLPSSRRRIAPTEVDTDWRGRLLAGEVHDENTWAVGGVAGQAGLFGSAPAVGCYARLVMQTLAGDTRLGPSWLQRRFVQRSRVPGSSRALAWDTMLPTSSCGGKMSRFAIGHTGFTGTSLWIDPVSDVYVVFLTNRVHPKRPADRQDRLAKLRPKVHDAVMAALYPSRA
jgi:CubicO group peptidase (beta-lactamase class C family)